MSRTLLLALALSVVACKGGGSDTSTTGDEDDDTSDSSDTDDTSAVDFFGELEKVVVATESDGLNKPSDIEFQPGTGIAFITNRADDSLVLLHDPMAEDPDADRRGGEDDVQGANHFLARPSALAFNDDGSWASIHMEDKKTQGPNGTPADFMGPTLWTGDVSILDGGHATHLDMLHNSPNGAGIAWVRDNAYYVVDGYHQSVTYYDFAADHGLGGADHTDGTILRCLEGEIDWVKMVGAHAVYEGGTLYVVDTGNNRVLAMDTASGTVGNPLNPNYDALGRDKFNYMDDVDFWVAIDTAAAGMDTPSGMEMDGDVMYVTDNALGEVFAFDMANDGAFIASLDLDVGSNALQGMGIDDNGTLWFVDIAENEVFRLE